ncbi:MAG: LPXTG cell wall anchor domain-containing protein [Bdellovibrionales bacterium]|nr:LPXTG cell wall anchor domain-containing protein [Bdellovibrionales bacterium]
MTVQQPKVDVRGTIKDNLAAMNDIASHQYHTFKTLSAVILGSLTGLLIAFPIATGADAQIGALAMIAGIGAGGLVGYRRRESRGFLYFSFVAILVLAGTISTSYQP